MNKFLYSIIGFGLVLGLYASCIEPFTLKVREWTVTTDKWTDEKPLRIALLSDLHMIRPWMTPAHLVDIVARVNELQPDVVMLLGDYVADHFFGVQLDPDEGLAPLKELSAPCGVFAVNGNHDLYNPVKADRPAFMRINPAGWPEAMIRTGIPLLENRAVRVDCAGRGFWVAGLGDEWWQKADAAGTAAQANDGAPVIMMMHNPDSFVNVPASVALSVAGHTHGGQVRVPFYGAIESVIPSRYGLKYVYGPVREDGRDLVVTSGLGMTGLPVRFLTPPEIAVVTLRKR